MTNFTPAQAAQQKNRAPGGQYAQKQASEPAVNLVSSPGEPLIVTDFGGTPHTVTYEPPNHAAHIDASVTIRSLDDPTKARTYLAGSFIYAHYNAKPPWAQFHKDETDRIRDLIETEASKFTGTVRYDREATEVLRLELELATAQDAVIRARIANIVTQLPLQAAAVSIEAEDESYDEDDSGHRISLGVAYDADGNEVCDVQGDVHFSSSYGTGDVWDGDWVNDAGELDVSKVRTWAALNA